jgi:hypothetical protein
LLHKRRLAGAAVLAVLVFGGAGLPGLAQAASGRVSQSASQSPAVTAILQNDFEIDGRVTSTVVATAGTPGTVTLDVDGSTVQVVLNSKTLIEVGPYAADANFLLEGVSATVWFHLDSNGNEVVDLIVIKPRTLKGTLESQASSVDQDGTTSEVVTVQVPARNGNAPVTWTVTILPETTVTILPPWDSTESLAQGQQVAVVGVVSAPRTLVAATEVAVVPQS